MIYNFKDQLNVGADGEKFFMNLYPKLVKTSGLISDFEYNGKGVELKTDTYAMDKTPNFFMEKLSSVDSGKIGGPWRAAQDNVDFFVYMFIKDRKCFWFRSKALVAFLDQYIVDKKPRSANIVNTSWTAMGYLIPRTAVTHLLLPL